MITGEYKLLDGLLWRAEYRHDYSNEPFFVTLATCAGGFGLQNSRHEDTLTIAFIGFFGPKR